MYKGKRFIALIPARGGSKGLPHKNRRIFQGKPLLVHTIRQAQAVAALDLIVVTSDDPLILSLAERAGALPVRRPAALASDKARTEPALLHALDTIEAGQKLFDYVVTLEPTHPFRRPETIQKGIAMVMRRGFDSLLTLTPDRTDFWRQKGGRYGRLFPNAPRRRQDREPLYKENSLLYVTHVAVLRKTGLVIGRRPAVLLTPERESMDIHSPADLEIAKVMATKHFRKD